MATPNHPSDMAQFFDFGEAAMPEMPEMPQHPTQHTPAKSHRVGCPAPANVNTDECLCHGFNEALALSQNLQEDVAQDEREWNPDFSSWIPRYHKPAHPCDYCRSKSLECFIYNSGGDGSAGCSPCNALFRPCSFSDPEKMAMQKSRTALDTLDVVTENNAHCFGGLTGKKQMRSLGHVGPIEDDVQGDKGSKKGAAAARFPRAAVKILKDWMIEHIDHPYPTEDEKETLKIQTGLTVSQISNWMANTRRRQKARPKRSASPSIRPSTEAIDIPPGRTWESLNPFERWKHSPPENEPAPMTAIAEAVQSFDLPEPSSTTSSYRKGNSNDSSSNFSVFRAPSTASLETGFTNVSSGSMGSHNSAYSHGSRNSFNSLNSLNSKKERRRRRRVPTRMSKLDLDPAPRLFQCTFCTDRFKSKYDWSRHEKSLHLSLEKWICAPLGESITCSSSGRRRCVYCDTLDPSQEHLATHNHGTCEEKGLEARTFYRKDHLRQHLRLMHGCNMTASMESWKSEAQFLKSRCGFCNMDFDKWQDRVDHLAKEFRNGANMKDWKGCRGLDPHVAVHVTNAMPPYLIANESKSPFPFSATNSASMKQHLQCFTRGDLEYLLPSGTTSPTANTFIHLNPGNTGVDNSSSISPTAAPTNTPEKDISSRASSHVPSSATCWEILTLRLGRFARQRMEKHGANSITDDMLQQEARRILYDSDDPWNQTAADNPEWLSLFKKAHGIDGQKSWEGTIQHHDVLEDLGIRLDATLDKSFDLSNFDCVKNTTRDAASQALAFEFALSGSLNMSAKTCSLLPGQQNCALDLVGATTTSVSNIPATTQTQYQHQGFETPILELACTVPGGICVGENGELGFASRSGDCARTKNLHFFPETTAFSMSPLRGQECTTNEGPIFSTATEMPSLTTNSTTQDDFALPIRDQLPNGFQVPGTAVGMSTSVPISMGVGDDMLGRLTLGTSNPVTGTMGGPQSMHWDDNELDFSIDMDLDVDIEMNVDAVAGYGMDQQP